MPPRFASLPHCLADGRQLFSVCARLAGNDSSDETTAYIPMPIASASCLLLAGAMFFAMQKRCLAKPDTSYLHSGRASPSLCRGWTKPEPLTNMNPVPGLTHGVVQKSEPGQGQMQDHPPQEQQRIMKGQEVIMRARSGQIDMLITRGTGKLIRNRFGACSMLLLDALRLFSFCWPLAVVAIAAGNEVDVVLAPGGTEGGIHLLDIQAAMRV